MFDTNKFQELLGNLQEKAKELEEKSKSEIYEVKSGGGLVSLRANGAGEIVDLNIDESLLSDKEAMQILLIGAFNEVFSKIEEGKKNQAMGMLGGINPFGQC
ncbi:nucleoid-associated protein, YbaB/EbfC family [Helicobacter cholecystus]|uniref:Nucleoid-associated protein CQA62_05020 n=1 Tax=Helicobacter cholecystus TaxID=45498 RepID=A0A3D8IWL3_9HELI|nr:YbaB/EbfC family nucleoid-associated protein [Helicobacter cholecystus]RDU68961.1 nucleoid-associated protein, YbaB/EbfC family [Helicobacter cholecystus]VEJ25997.1 transcriptional regulatory protein [Helicobacter cholecystus]